MSQRIFLECMRQEARDRGGYDRGRRSCSSSDPDDARRTAVAAAATGPNTEKDLADLLDSPEYYPVAPGVSHGDGAALLSSIPPPSDTSNSDDRRTLRVRECGRQQPKGDALRNSASDVPQTFVSPSQASLIAPHNHSEQQKYQHCGPGHRDGANSGSSSDGSSRRHHANLHCLESEDDFRHRPEHSQRSPDAIFKAGHGGASLSRNSSFSTSTTASAARRHSGSSRVCRTSRSASRVGDLRWHAGSDSSASRRFSQGRPSSTQPCKSIGFTSPLSVSLGAARRDRRGSIARVESSLVALQVELAAEKRNNIDAENHITTLNREVDRLRQENARLSREMAVAATAFHGASASSNSVAPGAGADCAGATYSSSTPQVNADVALKRIEVLEARLGELSRNMETKQHELDMKDERIRLLEHKLADQVLLYSEMSCMGTVATGLPQALQPVAMGGLDSATAPRRQQQQRRPSRATHKDSHNMSDVGGHRTPLRPYWQAQAPDTTPAGPKMSAIRCVNAHSLQVISPSNDSDNATSKLLSAEQTRSTHAHRRHSHGTGGWEEGARTGTGPQPSASSLRASQLDVKVNRPLSTTRDLRQPTTRDSRARGEPASTASRAGSADHTKNTEATPSRRGSGLSPWTRPATDKHSSCKRRSSRGSVASSGQAGDTSQPRPLGRSGSTGGPRRPSIQRRPSTSLLRSVTTATREGNQRESSRRTSAASPLYRQSSTTGSGGHPMHLLVGTSAGGDRRSLSPAGSTQGRSPFFSMLNGSPGRRRSATRSAAQQSVRSGTSTRSRPQITYSADKESSTMRGKTTTAIFRSSNCTSPSVDSSHWRNSYARDGVPLLPSRLAASAGAATAPNGSIEVLTDLLSNTEA
ncbi:hypothetical protein NXY56_002264 [Leishmania guyanensis]|uniref:Uncharacterized protein n=1 Tax=Leishmania guyanensis TaxID=5670 RepID=A0A1E1ISW5_LEIGU|nr:hypothetical protein, conserved [Leishmania guyanensis]